MSFVRGRTVAVSITLPLDLVDVIDGMAEEMATSRSAEMTRVLRAGLPEWALGRWRGVRDDRS